MFTAYWLLGLSMIVPGQAVSGQKDALPAALKGPSVSAQNAEQIHGENRAMPISKRSAPADQAALKPDPDGLGIAPWLVHLARHQGHLLGRSNPRSSMLHVMALLKASLAVSPRCGEAHYWLYDLEQRLGRPDASRNELAAYVRLTPNDTTAALRLLKLELDDNQTAEARAELIKKRLSSHPLAPAVESELHRELAAYYHERRERASASRELERALRLNPMNLAARELSYQMFGETEPALQRVEMALQLINMNPTQANLVWDLAEFLDRLSLHTRAQKWYRRAIQVHRLSSTAPISAERWHKLAVSYANGDDYYHAIEASDAALHIDPTLYTTRLLRAYVLRKLGRTEDADEEVVFISKDYASRINEVVEKKQFDEAARMAWFYSFHQPDPPKALMLGDLAMEDPQPSSLAKVAYGYALMQNGQSEKAVTILKPLATSDQLAAYALARAQLQKGQQSEAVSTLLKAATIQYSGIAYNLIGELLAQHGQSPPRPPEHPRVIAALDKFKEDVFNYPNRPQDFLRFSMRFANDPLPVVGPVRIIFQLENRGPFVITFGEGFMARPLVALSARLSGDPSITYENYLQILLNTRTMLLPGEKLAKTLAVDVGALRKHLIETVTTPVEIEMTAMFDPVYKEDRLTAGPGTVTSFPISTVRPALDTSASGLTAILDDAESADVASRIRAADQLGALLASHAALMREGLSSSNEDSGRVAGVDRADVLDGFRATLAKLLADPAWQVRAHAICASGWAKLDSRLTVAAAVGVRDQNAVVKLLSIRLFAEQHGEKFRKVLEQLRQSDPDPAVRMMAGSYLPEIANAQARVDGESR